MWVLPFTVDAFLQYNNYYTHYYTLNLKTQMKKKNTTLILGTIMGPILNKLPQVKRLHWFVIRFHFHVSQKTMCLALLLLQNN